MRPRLTHEEAEKIRKAWPKELKLSRLEISLMVLSALMLLVPLVHLVLVYGDLPAQMPAHYTDVGVVDAYKSKRTLLLWAGGAAFICLIAWTENFSLQFMDLPDALLKRPAEQIIHGFRLTLNVSNIACMGMFGYIIESKLALAMGTITTTHDNVLWLPVFVMLAACITHFVWLWRT